MSIAIIGQGYVGLPLSLQFARCGATVLGLDIDLAKVEALNQGRSYIKHITAEAVAEQVKAGRFSASADFSRIREVEAVIICVPTPLNKNREPDISYILDTGRAIAPYLAISSRRQEAQIESAPPGSGGQVALSTAGVQSAIHNPQPSTLNSETTPSPPRPGRGQGEVSNLSSKHPAAAALPPHPAEIPLAPSDGERVAARPGEGKPLPPSILHPPSSAAKLVVLESTTYPGTTDEDLRGVLEQISGLKAGVDFHLAFSPEREDPGNPDSRVATIPKVIGGFTPACLVRATALYGQAIKTLVPVSSCRAAEATKLLENTFRSVNIALVNELKVVYQAMDIDVWEVIHAAKTKPFGFMPFYPGPGLGGHCIPIDPFYLTWKAREYGQHTRFIELAGEINSSMPEHVVRRVSDALNAARKPTNGSRILILGLAYKPNVDDDRESPSYVLMTLLKQRGAEVSYYDPYVPVIKPTREHPQFAGIPSVAWDQATIQSFDLVLIATNHAAVNYGQLADWATLIVDTRNAMAGLPTHPGQVWQA